MADQRRLLGEDKSRWRWATVPDTTVLRMRTYIWELGLRVTELEGLVSEGEGPERPQPLIRDELDDLLGIGSDASRAEYAMP